MVSLGSLRQTCKGQADQEWYHYVGELRLNWNYDEPTLTLILALFFFFARFFFIFGITIYILGEFCVAPHYWIQALVYFSVHAGLVMIVIFLVASYYWSLRA